MQIKLIMIPLKVICKLYPLLLLFPSMLLAQTTFDIRLAEVNNNRTDEICYQVSLASSTATSWNLASQNYRLYYDTEVLAFKEGTSLLGDDFQDFTLVQAKEEVDAGGVEGCLHYAYSLGFLNYSLDLLGPK